MNSVAGISMTERKAAPIKVGLVQINNSFSGQSYLPYSVGLLESYVLFRVGDEGISRDYAAYRAKNRAKLEEYMDKFVVSPAPKMENAQ